MKEDDRISVLVAEWDDVYKKGQLSLWILLALFDGKKYAAQINQFMVEATGGTFEVKEQSLYRALRRFRSMGLVSMSTQESPNGPPRKHYELTAIGKKVLGRFVELNISPLLTSRITRLLITTQEEGKRNE